MPGNSGRITSGPTFEAMFLDDGGRVKVKNSSGSIRATSEKASNGRFLIRVFQNSNNIFVAAFKRIFLSAETIRDRKEAGRRATFQSIKRGYGPEFAAALVRRGILKDGVAVDGAAIHRVKAAVDQFRNGMPMEKRAAFQSMIDFNKLKYDIGALPPDQRETRLRAAIVEFMNAHVLTPEEGGTNTLLLHNGQENAANNWDENDMESQLSAMSLEELEEFRDVVLSEVAKDSKASLDTYIYNLGIPDSDINLEGRTETVDQVWRPTVQNYSNLVSELRKLDRLAEANPNVPATLGDHLNKEAGTPSKKDVVDRHLFRSIQRRKIVNRFMRYEMERREAKGQKPLPLGATLASMTLLPWELGSTRENTRSEWFKAVAREAKIENKLDDLNIDLDKLEPEDLAPPATVVENNLDALDGQDAYFANLRNLADQLGINMDSDSESDDDSLSDTGVNFREPEPRLEDENFDVALVEESDVQR